jgi:hypothetical protein
MLATIALKALIDRKGGAGSNSLHTIFERPKVNVNASWM